MALGDGSTWDESTPTDATVGIQIDDYIRDVRIGVRGRLANEHEWPASQGATSEAGMHKYITLQNQSTKPSLAGTQVGAIYQKTSNLFYQNSAGVEIQFTVGTGLSNTGVASGALTGNYPAPLLSTTSLLTSYIYNAGLTGSTVEPFASVKICRGSASLGANNFAVVTNLPFANSTSYSMIACENDYNAGDESRGSVGTEQVSGSTCNIYNTDNQAHPVRWIAIGV